MVSVEKYEEENLGVNPTPRKGHHKWVDAAVLRARLNQSTILGTAVGRTEFNGQGLRCADANDGAQLEHLLADKDRFPRNRPFQSPRFRTPSTGYASNIHESYHQRVSERNFAERKKDSLRNSTPPIQIPDSGKVSDVAGARPQMSAYQRCQVVNKVHCSKECRLRIICGNKDFQGV